MSLIPVAQAASGMITRNAARNLIPVLSDIASGVGSAANAYKTVRSFARRGRQRSGGNRGRSGPNPFSAYGRGGGGGVPPTPPYNNYAMDVDPSSSNNNNNPGHSMVRRLRNSRSFRRRLGGRRRQLTRGLRRRPNLARINRVVQRGNKRRYRRAERKLKPIDHAKKGITQITQSCGTVGGGAADSDRCVYLGHGTCPSELTLFTSFLALCKKVLLKAGFDVRGVDNALPNPMVFTWGYYPNARTTTLSTIASATPAQNTLEQIAADLYAKFAVAVTDFPSMQPYELRLDYGNNIYYVHTDKCHINISCKSILKIQNRTPNASGNANVDVNNVNYIQGIKYSGTGTGSYYNDVRIATSAVAYQPFVVGRRTGFFSRTDLPSVGAESLQTPPSSKSHFSYVKQLDKIKKFMPGETKISILIWNKQMSYTKFINQYLQDINNNTYNLAQVGKFAFYGLTKYIDDDVLNKPTFAYEVENHYGMTITKDTNPLTVQAYIPQIQEEALKP